MGYQSKTYSLHDDVVAAIELAKAGGVTPSRYLAGLIERDCEPSVPLAASVIEHRAAQKRAALVERAPRDTIRRPIRQKGDKDR